MGTSLGLLAQVDRTLADERGMEKRDNALASATI
jgi:hypothetical protein